MALAQVVTEGPKMANHARGLWGYSGKTASGRGLTVQSTGMGGPSAALVLRDLAELGVRRAVRIGTGAALRPGQRARGPDLGARGAGLLGGRPRRSARPPAPTRRLADSLRATLGDDALAGTVASLDVLHPSPGHAAPDGDARRHADRRALRSRP